MKLVIWILARTDSRGFAVLLWQLGEMHNQLSIHWIDNQSQPPMSTRSRNDELRVLVNGFMVSYQIDETVLASYCSNERVSPPISAEPRTLKLCLEELSRLIMSFLSEASYDVHPHAC